MNAGNKITIKSIDPDDARLPLVINDSISNPSLDKILKVVKSYDNPNYEIIDAKKIYKRGNVFNANR